MTIRQTIVQLIVFAVFGAIHAQTVTERFEFGYAGGSALSIPKEFSYNGVPYLMMYDANDANSLLVYDDNLDVVKTIVLKEQIPFSCQLTYQDQVRDVLAVNETQRNQYCQFVSFDVFVQQEKNMDAGFDKSWLAIKDLGDGTKMITVDYSNSSFSNNVQMYFAYATFGMKYPKVYFIESADGTVVGYRASYGVQYSEWRNDGTRVVDCSEPQKRIRLCNINLNNGDGKADKYFEVSQTLFNEDASFEYVMPKYKLSTNGNIGNRNTIIDDGNADKIITSQSIVISEQKELALAGFNVVSESGDIISDITFDGGFEGKIYLDCAFLITIANNTYLAFDGYCNNASSTIFYKIDKATNAIQKVKITPSTMNVLPTIANNGEIINVSFDDDNEQGSEIIVLSAAGAMVKRYRVPAGQTSCQIQTNSSSGMYCVSRIKQGKRADTQKIFIK